MLPGQSQRSSTNDSSSLLWMTQVSGLSSAVGGSLEHTIQPDWTEVPVQVSPALTKTRRSVSSATHALGSKPISVNTMLQPTTYGASSGQRVTLQSPSVSSTSRVSGSEPVPPALRPPLPPASVPPPLPPLALLPPVPSVPPLAPLPPVPSVPPLAPVPPAAPVPPVPPAAP